MNSSHPRVFTVKGVITLDTATDATAVKRFSNNLLMCGATLPIWNHINDQLRRNKNDESSHLESHAGQTTLGEKIVG